jgi:hypothetical protein
METPTTRSQTRAALEALQRAVETGDLQHLLDILAPDVVFLGDGGGVVKAALTPVVGADRVARLLAAGLGRVAAAVSLQPAQVNGYPALMLRLNGEIDGVLAVRIDDGLVTGLYYVRNPEKAVTCRAGDRREPLSPKDSVGRSARRVAGRPPRFSAASGAVPCAPRPSLCDPKPRAPAGTGRPGPRPRRRRAPG